MHSHSDERVLSFGFSGATVTDICDLAWSRALCTYCIQVHTVECMIE